MSIPQVGLNSATVVKTPVTEPSTAMIEGIRYKKAPFFEGKGIDVGCMREDWQFPSDHLPIGVRLLSKCPFQIISWNVLNNVYLNHVYDGYQGLQSSLITQENENTTDDGLTQRDQHIINIILDMVNSQTSSNGVLSFQECNPVFIHHLKCSASTHYSH